jgi:hypothetical protein
LAEISAVSFKPKINRFESNFFFISRLLIGLFFQHFPLMYELSHQYQNVRLAVTNRMVYHGR